MNVSSFKAGRTVSSPAESEPKCGRLPACLRQASCPAHSAAPPSAKIRATMTGFRKCGAVGHRALPARLLDLVIIIMLTMAAPGAALAQEARLVNAQTQTRAVTSGLEKEFRSLVKNQVEPAWIGYAVPVVEGNHHICCYSSEESRKPASLRRGRCQLESRDEGMNFKTNGDDDTRENPGRVLVLWRVADRNVGKIRVFTDDCELDAGGLTVHWLTDVKPKESIDLLASFVGET